MAPNMNVQSNASEKVFVLAVLVGVDHGGASCCGYAWTCDSDRDGDGDDDGDVFALRSDCPPLQPQKGGRSHSDGTNMPEWNQAHRAHQQIKDGGSISQLTCALRRAHDFSNKIASKTQSTKQSSPIKRAPPLVII